MRMIAVVILFLICGCVENISQLQKAYVPLCEDQAMSLIPENITLYRCLNGIFPTEWTFPQDQMTSKITIPAGGNAWNDGRAIETEWTLFEYHSGSVEGENVNYVYYRKRPFITKDSSLVYSKQIINKNGKIMGTRSFSIQPILKIVNGTSWIFPNGWVKCEAAVFEVVSPNFISCVWVNE